MKKVVFTTLAVALVMAACGKKEKPASLGSQDWELYEVVFKDAADADVNAETPPMGITLMFNDSLMMASGHSGCNRYSTPYTLKGQNVIWFGTPIVTQTACPDMEFENRYLNWFLNVESYEVRNDELLLNGDEFTLIYKPEFK